MDRRPPQGAVSALLGFSLTALVAACVETPQEPVGGAEPDRVEVLSLAEVVPSGDRVSLAVRVLDRVGAPVAGAEVVFTTTDGTLTPSVAKSGTDGKAEVFWTLADRDGQQEASVRAALRSATARVTTEPQVSDLRLSVDSTAALGTTLVAEVTAITNTGRTLAWTGEAGLAVLEEVRTHAPLGVLLIQGRKVQATGPGSARITASVRSFGRRVDAPPVILRVRRAPIVTELHPIELPSGGGNVVLHGYDLDQVEDVRLDGRHVPLEDRSAERLVIPVAAAAAACSGRGRLDIEVMGAWAMSGPLFVRRARSGESKLEPGQYALLGGSSEACVRLPAVGEAEYSLVYFDTRGIRGAISTFEDPLLREVVTTMRISDTSGGEAAAPSIVPNVTRAPPGAPSPQDVRPAGAGPGATTPPADYYLNRSSPWVPGNRFSIMEGTPAGVSFPGGEIFHATSGFAFGILDRDASLNVRSRLVGLTAALERFHEHAEPLLRAVLVDEWPSTTQGSGQVLVVVGQWGWGGIVLLGHGLGDRGTYLGLDPGVATLPPGDPLFLDARLLVHEMVHVFQDRYLMRRCTGHGDCGTGAWYYRWATEGTAELLAEHASASWGGFDFEGNNAYEGPIHNALGFLFASEGNHWRFSDGYGSSSWLLRDLVMRLRGHGLSMADAFGIVAKGALEGWHGWLPFQQGHRTGLSAGMRDGLKGPWDPSVAAVTGVLAVAADDRTSNPALQVPFLREAWRRYPEAAEFVLGGGGVHEATVHGLTFAHFSVRDPSGEGGSLAFASTVPGFELGIVRIR